MKVFVDIKSGWWYHYLTETNNWRTTIKVRIYNMVDGGWFYCPIDNLTLSQKIRNMDCKWAWNDSDEQRANGDGECIYVEFN